MNTNEAAVLAAKIRGAFDGPTVDVWEEDLAELDAGRAGTAFARVRRAHKARWLSIGEFMDHYRAVHTEQTSTTVDCADCDTTGWTPGPSIKRDGTTYTTVRPCRCPAGERAARSAVWAKRTALKKQP